MSSIFFSLNFLLRHRYDHLNAAVNAKRISDRSIIVEGIRIVLTLERINVSPDYLIIVKKRGHRSALNLVEQFEGYEQHYETQLSKADFRFDW